MARSVGLSKQAAAKLASIRRWYAQPGAGAVAARRIQALVAAIEQLGQFPLLGGAGPVPGTRELAAEDHRIVYEINGADASPDTAGDIIVLDIFGPGEA